jgi:MFS family permease
VAYFLGNLAMKSVTTRVLRTFGFRRVLVVNGTLAAASVTLCGLLGPAMPYPVIVTILFVAGLTRSMQFTALATLAFADIDAEQRSSASTLSAMFQQVAMVFGIALATAFLNLSQAARSGAALALDDFRTAFLLMAAIVLLGAAMMLRLPRNAGVEVSGHRLS